MAGSGDYFAAAPVLPPVQLPADPLPRAPQGPASEGRTAPLWVVIAAASVVVVIGLAVALTGRRPPDTRPIALPASIGGHALRDDADAVTQRGNVQTLVTQIWGDNAATSAQYGHRGILINLLVGRGPSYKEGVGDPGITGPARTHFGDVTCGHLKFGKSVLTSMTVCWYSTPSFGASLLVSQGAGLSMPEVAEALEAAIPGMRDAPTPPAK